MKKSKHMKNVQPLKSIQHMKNIQPNKNTTLIKTFSLRKSFKVFEPYFLAIFFAPILFVEIGISQLATTCSNSTIETLESGVKYVQS